MASAVDGKPPLAHFFSRAQVLLLLFSGCVPLRRPLIRLSVFMFLKIKEASDAKNAPTLPARQHSST